MKRNPPRFYFNPRAPCGARPKKAEDLFEEVKFQPTRPLRGATTHKASEPQQGRHFNPRAPCGARPFPFSIFLDASGFQPTRPLRGATSHSLSFLHCYDFNPRAPCGARQQKCTNHYAHFCDNRQISDAFAQNAACQGILLLFDAGKPCGFWVRTAQVISARLCFAL